MSCGDVVVQLTCLGYGAVRAAGYAYCPNFESPVSCGVGSGAHSNLELQLML